MKLKYAVASVCIGLALLSCTKEPKPSEDNIVFKDNVARIACVEKFDTDGDGEVSVAEAEAATSFDGLFTNWKGVTSFEEISYFKNVHSLSGVFYDCDKLVSITIPENINDLGTSAFYGCSSLISISLPSGITAIGNNTFENCSKLASIDIPSGVTSVESYAFYGVNMWKLDLPSTVTYLGSQSMGSINCVIVPSTSPVSIESDTFSGVYAVFVPSKIMEMYKAMTHWSSYSSMLHPLTSYKDKDEFVLCTSGAVDMGLSVKWAAYNVGATKPEEYGDYYAWGETETKSNYNWDTYFDSIDGSDSSFKKYYNGGSGKTVLELEDDVAHVKWGGSWRMPTDAEMGELGEYCLWEWTTYEGINGRMVYGFGAGNKIFLPAAGSRCDTCQEDVGSNGIYWSSSLHTDYSYYAQSVSFFSDYVYWGIIKRCFGRSVRPVSE